MESTEAKIVQLEDYRQTFTGVAEATSTRVRLQIDGASANKSTATELSDVYPLGTEGNPMLAGSTELLNQINNSLQIALDQHNDGRLIDADDTILQVTAMAADLFAFRSLGDGFGSVALATFHGLRNTSEPLTRDQIYLLTKTMARLRREPFMSFEAALEIHAAYEAIGLDPDPRGIVTIVDDVIGQQ